MLVAAACATSIVAGSAAIADARPPAAEEYDLVIPGGGGTPEGSAGTAGAGTTPVAPTAASRTAPVTEASPAPATAPAPAASGSGNDAEAEPESVEPVGPRAAVDPVLLRPVGQIVPAAEGASGDWKLIVLAVTLLGIAGAGAWLRVRQGSNAAS